MGRGALSGNGWMHCAEYSIHDDDNFEDGGIEMGWWEIIHHVSLGMVGVLMKAEVLGSPANIS